MDSRSGWVRAADSRKFLVAIVNEIGVSRVYFTESAYNEKSKRSEVMLTTMPRYPDIHVRLHSRNPFALVSAVRQALRRSEVEENEIRRFSDEAMEVEEPGRMRDVCSRWAEIDDVG